MCLIYCDADLIDLLADDGQVRRWMLAALVGAAVGAGFLALSDALSPQGTAACAAGDGTCPTPPLFTWSAIRPAWVLLGAAIGAVLGVGVAALVMREQRRRDRVGA
jgi:hypothetical protein